ncbi:putative S-adenosyl-L-methionine dependent methyltransferase [Janthinobacterium sp. HH01]|uniref:class I SAM-dependent methyltransferase n=1 Tax=Janthinobacterium sp. HH01 TaxID=1198452 RepID=UPI0002AEB3DA|nr:class I SAM-dependent methyltransferase [Janthinobacterium sp. HH01]ELX12076.1 putative S-adenosyl-L-methionine dependent methyltransferase [Janthinobacterium sp. HH01]
MKRTVLAALATTTMLFSAGGAIAAEDAALKAAIAAPSRTPANVERDVYRHPYETLSFFGIKPTMTVVELAPGGGWYTEILAPYLRDHGKLIAAGNDLAAPDANERKAAERYMARLNAKPEVYNKVALGVFSPPRKYEFAPAGSVDMVITFRNIHNWMGTGPDNLKTLFGSVYTSLKKGGVFGVVEHRLPASKVQDKDASTGYMHEKYVIGLAEAAGFKLADKSEVNANPKDNAEHQGGVWALPPTYANKDADREMYKAIGESDRMTLKFVKP